MRSIGVLISHTYAGDTQSRILYRTKNLHQIMMQVLYKKFTNNKKAMANSANNNYYYYCFTASWTVSGTIWVSRYQKGKSRKVKPIWIYWSKRQWVAVASAGYMQVCISSQTDNHASIPPLSFFTGQMPFLSPNQQRQSTEGNSTNNKTTNCHSQQTSWREG